MEKKPRPALARQSVCYLARSICVRCISPPQTHISPPPVHYLFFVHAQYLSGGTLLSSRIGQPQGLRGRHLPERHRRRRLQHLSRAALLRDHGDGGAAVSRGLLLPPGDGIRHRVSLPQRDVLERAEPGGGIGVLSLSPWKVPYVVRVVVVVVLASLLVGSGPILLC